MKTRLLPLTALLTLALSGCASAPSAEQQAQMAADARGVVGGMVKKLGGTLKQEISANGPAVAIAVCREKAPQIAKATMAEHGVKLRRVTTQSRNPNSVPDEWEAKVLADFEARLAKGDSPDSLESYQVVTEGETKTFRYMKGLVIQPLCLTCHGGPDNIPEDVKAKLAELYPNDKATGYSLGMLRGAVTIKKPL